MKRFWINHIDGGSEHSPDWRTDQSADTFEEAKQLAEEKRSQGYEVVIFDSEIGEYIYL